LVEYKKREQQMWPFRRKSRARKQDIALLNKIIKSIAEETQLETGAMYLLVSEAYRWIHQWADKQSELVSANDLDSLFARKEAMLLNKYIERHLEEIKEENPDGGMLVKCRTADSDTEEMPLKMKPPSLKAYSELMHQISEVMLTEPLPVTSVLRDLHDIVIELSKLANKFRDVIT